MRIFSWVQNKFNNKKFDGVPTPNRRSSAPESQNEPNCDWPNTLLSIGTMGNQELQEDHPRHDINLVENLEPADDLPDDITMEEVCKLRKELTKLLSRKRKSSEMREYDRANLPLDRFLNCPSSLEVDRTVSTKVEATDNENNGDLSPNSKLILNKVKDMLLGNRNTIKKKSASFLFRKIFTCAGGFTPAPSLRNSIPESKIEKILKTILTKKVYPQSSAPRSTKKFLENGNKKTLEKGGEIEETDGKKDNCKWVKTDSEYIVLEI